MPIKSKVFIQTLQKSQDRHKISFAFEFNDKNTKKVLVIAFLVQADFPNTIKFFASEETVFIALRTRGKDNRQKFRKVLESDNGGQMYFYL